MGIIGDIKTRGKYKKYYNVWKNMILRCYKEGVDGAYYNKVTVCDRWRTFELFYEDIAKIDGWDKEMFDAGLLELDKDIKQRYQNNKMYSPETCTLVPRSINAHIQDAQQRQFRATSPEGIIYYDYNISDFGRKHGFERRQISSVLHKRVKSSLGWKFEYVDEEIV